MPDAASRHSRTIAVPGIGPEGQARISAASVCLVGVGGLGSPVATYLTGAGVGRLTIVDHDRVEEHNLQRQVIHSTRAVGELKVLSAAMALRELNPEVHVVPRDLLLDADNAVEVLAGHDLVVDATDNLPVRFAIADAAEELDLPVVYGSVSSTRAQVTVFRASLGHCLRNLVDESQAEGVTRLDEVGVLGPLTGMAGSAMAIEALKLLAGAGEPLIGRLLYLDAFSGEPTMLDLLPS